MGAEKDLSKHSCVVMLGLAGTLVGIVVGCIAIFTFVTGRPSLLGANAQDQRGVIEAAPMESAAAMPTPDVSNFVPQPAVPTNTCSGAIDYFWLQYPDLWYGPDVYNGGDGLAFSSAGGFYVWDADAPNFYGGLGASILYPDSSLQWPRDQWIDLSDSIFSVCIDTVGNVFGRVR